MTAIHHSSFLAPFQCLADRCEDTCCRGWGMQVDSATLERYADKAPELLGTVTEEGGHTVMRRQADSFCVQFTGGLCGTQAKHGAEMLGDACYLFPRITRQLGSQVMQSASLSCPEITRLALLDEVPRYTAHDASRLPIFIRQVLPEGVSEEEAATIHERFLQATLAERTPERLMIVLVDVAHSLERLPLAQWASGVEFYLRSAEGRLPAPEPQQVDPVLIVQAVDGLARSASPLRSARLDHVISRMMRVLAMVHDTHGLPQPSLASAEASAACLAAWKARPLPDFLLRRFIAAQLSMMLFPFAGLGAGPVERATLLGLRFAITRLGLMALVCETGENDVGETEIVEVIQSLSRLLDHLADPTLPLEIMKETGWIRPARLRSVIGDDA